MVRPKLHNNTIRKYVQALLNAFNDLEVQYLTTDEKIITKEVPIVYASREKSNIADFVTQDFLERGNYNILPRSYIRLQQIQKSEERVLNKLIKTNINIQGNFQEYIFNPVPYEFTFEYTLMCRGMNEASQLIESIQTRFNPTLEIDIWEAQNQTEQTRVPVRLLDIQLDQGEYLEDSVNIITIDCTLQIHGNLYQPLNLERFSDNCDGLEINGRLMPVIKELGYTLGQSQDPKSKEFSGISRIEVFDVDEEGDVICSSKKDLTQEYDELENIMLALNVQDLTPVELKETILKVKKIIFELKSRSNSFKIQEIHDIIWGYDSDLEKLKKTKALF